MDTAAYPLLGFLAIVGADREKRGIVLNRPRVCFVIPTYNEAENITLLLGRLTYLYPDANTLFLVVDDESPDGTGALVRQFAGGDPRVYLLEGRKRGLGAAYVRGITHATDSLGADVVVQMDADFSHDPEDAGRLLARVATDADVAIGSRYVAGGAVDESWGFRRRQLSLWGNRMARWIAGLKGVRDCTAGFKAIRASAPRAARVEEISVLGYAFQVALLHRLLHSGARVVEEPIYFRDRQRGVTKLGLDSMLEFMYHISWLRLTSHRTFIKLRHVPGPLAGVAAGGAGMAAGTGDRACRPGELLSQFLLDLPRCDAKRD